MASAFIGISVVVTLQNPANTLVHGVVAAVNAQNSTLTLQDGKFVVDNAKTGHVLT
jgi:enhancer of mRNA-decapping protein 3